MKKLEKELKHQELYKVHLDGNETAPPTSLSSLALAFASLCVSECDPCARTSSTA
jgi:hypothetical protein